MSDRAALITAARHQLWRDGRALEYLLDDRDLTRPETGGQQGWVRRFRATPPYSATYWNVSRQRGKSYGSQADDIELCATQPGTRVFTVALTGEGVHGVLKAGFDQILGLGTDKEPDCPPDMMPVITDDGARWANGSVYEWAGTDQRQYRRYRGRHYHRVKLSECGFYSDLEAVEAVVEPMIQTTKGRLLYESSPPESEAHPAADRLKAARGNGRYEHATIYDNPRLAPADIDALIDAIAERLNMTREQLLASTYWKREYLAQLVTEAARAAIPWWVNNPEEAKKLVRKRERPKYFDGYASYDWSGKRDPHAALFAWYSPEAGLHIERFLERPLGSLLEGFCGEAKALETELWGVNKWDGRLLGAPEWLKALTEMPEFLQPALRDGASRQPYLRVGDDNPIVLQELAITHGYTVLPTRKDDKHLAVDRVGAFFKAGRITIDPDVVRLIEQLSTTIWNKHRTEWERTKKDHGDLIDCLVYLCRNVQWHRETRPEHVVNEWFPAATIKPPASVRRWDSMLRAKRRV